jgi:hypothetical protein
MTLTQFDNGYWYAAELKHFAADIGVPGAQKLRKDELESAIKLFLRTGTIELPIEDRHSAPRVKDVVLGLSLDRVVVAYTSDKETKDFLDKEAQRLAPGLRRKSGVRYRLNRWREEQLRSGRKLTYRDLVKEYVRLNRGNEPFARIPHGRYINFLSDFLAREKDATREQANNAWQKLKTLDAPKNYQSWKKTRSATHK